jgi:hypothetical protein
VAVSKAPARLPPLPKLETLRLEINNESAVKALIMLANVATGLRALTHLEAQTSECSDNHMSCATALRGWTAYKQCSDDDPSWNYYNGRAQ